MHTASSFALLLLLFLPFFLFFSQRRACNTEHREHIVLAYTVVMQWFGGLLVFCSQMVFATNLDYKTKAEWIAAGRPFDNYYNPYPNGSAPYSPPDITGNKRNDEEIEGLKFEACALGFAKYFAGAAAASKFCKPVTGKDIG